MICELQDSHPPNGPITDSGMMFGMGVAAKPRVASARSEDTDARSIIVKEEDKAK